MNHCRCSGPWPEGLASYPAEPRLARLGGLDSVVMMTTSESREPISARADRLHCAVFGQLLQEVIG